MAQIQPPDPARQAPYEVAPLPEDEVDKLRRLEEELSEDTGDEVVLIAYRRQRRDAS
jgi:hypothetical protein